MDSAIKKGRLDEATELSEEISKVEVRTDNSYICACVTLTVKTSLPGN